MNTSTPLFVVSLGICLLFGACGAPGGSPKPGPGTQGFDGAQVVGWKSDSTGGRGPSATWALRGDAHAPSAPNVLALTAENHQDEDRFNLHWTANESFRDGKIAVSVRADEGEVDQGGGPIWRVQDANNYYVCRINPLEANYRVYVVRDGVRKQLATARADVQTGSWHRLEVQHVGSKITCSLDGKALLHVDDGSIPAAGGVGVWTKADARTSFDDLTVQASP